MKTTEKKPNSKVKTFEETAKEYLKNFENVPQETILFEIRQLSYFINHLTLKLWPIREDEQENADAENAEKEEISTNGKLVEEEFASK